ncbi:MAG: hypothetical protein EOP84_08825 [Verrucomicrobiaceae bacterium]|nr:MAG: hypothetical protein EOP84_08825 [Verrucomicrobiaceae bacterium]
MKKFALLCAALASVGLLTAQGAVVDLTTQSTVSLSTSYGTAIFTTDFTRPTGTGVFEPFLTLQANGTEQGYNTSAKKGVFDTKREPQWNHEIRVQDLAKVTIGGAQYYSFLIDVNEPNGGNKSLISLDSLKIFTSTKKGQTTQNVESLGTKRFDLDRPSNSYILYDDKNSGSGQGDIAFFIPTSAFIGASPTDYVYMYQMWGNYASADRDYDSDGGFEETAIGFGVVPIPEVASILPLGLVFGAVVGVRHLRRRRTEDMA